MAVTIIPAGYGSTTPPPTTPSKAGASLIPFDFNHPKLVHTDNFGIVTAQPTLGADGWAFSIATGVARSAPADGAIWATPAMDYQTGRRANIAGEESLLWLTFLDLVGGAYTQDLYHLICGVADSADLTGFYGGCAYSTENAAPNGRLYAYTTGAQAPGIAHAARFRVASRILSRGTLLHGRGEIGNVADGIASVGNGSSASGFSGDLWNFVALVTTAAYTGTVRAHYPHQTGMIL